MVTRRACVNTKYKVTKACVLVLILFGKKHVSTCFTQIIYITYMYTYVLWANTL